MLGRIEHQTYRPEPEYSNETAFLDIRLLDGRTIKGRADFGKGSPERPLTRADVVEKFRACAAAGGLPRDRAERIAELVAKLETLDDIGPLIREIMPS
jgi:2-methylcitrate dehydratase PrpD